MDILKRQKAPIEEKEEKNYLADRQAFKLALRKEKINNTLSSKRNPSQSIKGYNLSRRWKRHKYIIKRCWVCGKPDHFKAECPILLEILLIKGVIVL